MIFTLGEILDNNTQDWIKRFPCRVEPFVEAKLSPNWIDWKKRNGSVGVGEGSAGCWIGHWRIWKQISESSFPCNSFLVLEDDAQVTSLGQRDFLQILRDFENMNFNMLHLGNHQVSFKQTTNKILSTFPFISQPLLSFDGVLNLISRRQEYYPLKFPHSTHAYLINRQFAEALSRLDVSFLFPVDVMLNAASQVTNNQIYASNKRYFIQNSKLPSRVKRLGR